MMIADLGLDCVFIIPADNSDGLAAGADMFGKRGKEAREFRDPTDIIVDDVGNMIVVDSRNSRLQVFDDKTEYVGNVKPDITLARPCRIFMDKEARELFIGVKLSKCVYRCKF